MSDGTEEQNTEGTENKCQDDDIKPKCINNLKKI